MQVKNFGKGKNIADIILVLVLLIVGLSVFLIIELSRDAGDSVRVYSNGEFVGEYSLSVDGEYSLNGGNVCAFGIQNVNGVFSGKMKSEPIVGGNPPKQFSFGIIGKNSERTSCCGVILFGFYIR